MAENERGVEERLDTVEAGLRNVDRRLDSLQRSADTMREEIDGLKDVVGRVEADMKEMLMLVKGLAARLGRGAARK